jgi:AbiV family abortive infection protein
LSLTQLVFSAMRLLVDNGRYASAFALSVLALEEIGKVVLELWDASPSGQRPSSHHRKQAAVSSLLLAQYTTKELSDLVSSGPMTAELIERVARAMYESEAGKFARLVDFGAIDKTKQLAFYRDDWLESAGIHADQFDASDVTQLFDKCRSAIAAVGNSKTMRVGRAIYKAQRNPALPKALDQHF